MKKVDGVTLNDKSVDWRMEKESSRRESRSMSREKERKSKVAVVIFNASYLSLQCDVSKILFR